MRNVPIARLSLRETPEKVRGRLRTRNHKFKSGGYSGVKSSQFVHSILDLYLSFNVAFSRINSLPNFSRYFTFSFVRRFLEIHCTLSIPFEPLLWWNIYVIILILNSILCFMAWNLVKRKGPKYGYLQSILHRAFKIQRFYV